MKQLFLFYAVFCYLIFLGTMLYAIGFVAGFAVPKSIDSGSYTPELYALAIDLGLLAIFAVQHSLMARQGFKALWTRIVPKPLERSTYVLLSSLALMLLFWQWRPLGDVLWDLRGSVWAPLLWALGNLGWVIVFASTFLLDHFSFTGLRQAYSYLLGKEMPPVRFQTPGLYKIVRHPMYLGLLIAFWITPIMTLAHFLFALGMTIYILLGMALEERDLLRTFGDSYREYQKRVPKLFPRPWRMLAHGLAAR
jgi:protein-S-isoprenylcysteine O-methyltransferase Ste14